MAKPKVNGHEDVFSPFSMGSLQGHKKEGKGKGPTSPSHRDLSRKGDGVCESSVNCRVSDRN